MTYQDETKTIDQKFKVSINYYSGLLGYNQVTDEQNFDGLVKYSRQIKNTVMLFGTWGAAYVFMGHKIGCLLGAINGLLMLIFYANNWVPYVNQRLESQSIGHVVGQIVLAVLLYIRLTLKEREEQKQQENKQEEKKEEVQEKKKMTVSDLKKKKKE